MRSGVCALAVIFGACTPGVMSTATPTASATPIASATPRSTVATTTPSAAPPLRTPQPLPSVTVPSLVLRYDRHSDIPVESGPELLVVSDGQVLSTPWSDRRLGLRRLSPAGVELLVRSVLDTGLFNKSRSIQRHVLPGASPNLNRGFEWLSISVKSGDRDVTVSTFARDAEDGLYTWDAGRERLLALAERLADLGWLPASAWVVPAVSPYVAVYHRLYVETAPNLVDCAGRPGGASCLDPLVSVSVDGVWPFTVDPGRFGEAVPADPNLPPAFGARCAILAADDARTLGEAIARTSGTTYHPELRITSSTYRWPAGSGEVYLQLEPLLPNVAPTCAGVGRRY